MRSWTEDFGQFYTNSLSWDSRKEICIRTNSDTTAEQMVVMAIALAKKYNCKIVGRVEYKPELVGGTVSFVVECHSLTYRYFYDGGNTDRLHSSEVKDSDIAKYREKFGTVKCIHKSFKKKYWYTDNWYGNRKEFNTLKAAKKAAGQETGNSVAIYTNYPFGRGSRIVCFAPASGITPP